MPSVLHVCTRYLRGASERRLLDVMRAMPEVEHHLVVGGDSWPALAEARVLIASLTFGGRPARRTMWPRRRMPWPAWSRPPSETWSVRL